MPNQWVRGTKQKNMVPVVRGRPTWRGVTDWETRKHKPLEGWDICVSKEKLLEIAPALAERIEWASESYWPPAVGRENAELLGPDECAELDRKYGLKGTESDEA